MGSVAHRRVDWTISVVAASVRSVTLLHREPKRIVVPLFLIRVAANDPYAQFLDCLSPCPTTPGVSISGHLKMFCCPSGIPVTCAVRLAGEYVPLRIDSILGDSVDLFSPSPILVFSVDLVKMDSFRSILVSFRKRHVRLRV